MIFFFFRIFLGVEVEPIFGKARQNVQNCLNPKLIIGSTLENSFEATLRSKTNDLTIRK